MVLVGDEGLELQEVPALISYVSPKSLDIFVKMSLSETGVGPNGVVFGLAQELRPFVIIRRGSMVKAGWNPRSAINRSGHKGNLAD